MRHLGGARVTIESIEELTFLQVPHFCRPISRGGEQETAAGVEGHRGGDVVMRIVVLQQTGAAGVPQLHKGIIGSGGDALAIGMEASVKYASGEVLESMNALA